MTAANLERFGGAYQIQNLELIFFYLILMELKDFIIQYDKEIVDKILVGIGKMDRSDKK